MTAESLIADFRIRGIKLIPNPPKLVVKRADRLTDTDRELNRAHKDELLAALKAEQAAQQVESTQPPAAGPTYSILAACCEHGVALRIDETGDLVVGKASAKADESSQPWPTLIAALEAHVEEVARLVEAGWHLKARPLETAAA